MNERPQVRNASDRNQVKRADQLTKLRRDQELADLRSLLSTVAGRRVFFRLLCELRPNRNIFETGALLPYRAGQHDTAIFLLNEIEQADPDAYLRMLTEYRATQKREDTFKPATPRPVTPVDDDAAQF